MNAMNKHLTSVLGAGALSLAAMGASAPASATVAVAATQFPCPATSDFTQCYSGSVVGSLGDATFSDLNIGSLTLSQMVDLLGAVHTKWLNLTSVSLSSGGT